jgi:hypothetical protein
MVSDAVTGLDAGQTLDAVELWHAAQNEAEVRIFLAAAHFADLHHPDTRRREGPVLRGMEKPARLGGAGTPKVWEFAAAEFGPRIGRSPYAARCLIADALDTRHRLPRLWARVTTGEVPVRYARHVAQQTRDLSPDAAGVVDAAVVAYADGRMAWSRFESMVAAQVVTADPEAAAERERAAAQEEFAKLGQSNDHGQKTLYVKSSAAALARIDATLAYLAQALAALGHDDTEDRRRALAMLILANPAQALQLLQAYATHRSQTTATGTDGDASDDDGKPGDQLAVIGDQQDPGHGASDPAAGFRKRFRPHTITPDTRFSCGFDPTTLLPTVTLYLHLYARTDTGDVGPAARWEGEGPITAQYVRDLLGPHCSFTIKPVIDLANMAPVDGYEIPGRHREAVHLRTPADVFPFAANTGRRKQADHTQPYVPPDHGGPPGQTGLHNLGAMTVFHHRVKTHSPWQVKQPFPGIYLWRDPHGRYYLVDHTGTRPLGKATPGNTPPDLTADIHPEPDDGIDIRYMRRHAA